MEKNFFDKLLEKPEPYRRKVAIITTAVLAVMIFSAWLMITTVSLRQTAQKQAKETEKAQPEQKNLPSFEDEPSVKTRLMEQQEKQTQTQPADQTQTEKMPDPSAPSLFDKQSSPSSETTTDKPSLPVPTNNPANSTLPVKPEATN